MTSPEPSPAPDPSSTLITCRVSSSQLTQLLALFNAGKLADLGITAIQIDSEQQPHPERPAWTTRTAPPTAPDRRATPD